MAHHPPTLLLLITGGCGLSATATVAPAATCTDDPWSCARGGPAPGAPAELSLLQHRSGSVNADSNGHSADLVKPKSVPYFMWVDVDDADDPHDLWTDPAAQRERLQKIRPAAWLHVPESGASFINFMVRLPGVCRDHEHVGNYENAHNFYDEIQEEFEKQGRVTRCNGTGNWPDDQGIGGKEWANYQHHGFTMLRQPEQRVLASYHSHGGKPFWTRREPPKDKLEYARALAGCAVRMLTSSGAGACDPEWAEELKQQDVMLAIDRMKQLPFVGLTEEWALSICLGHRMFGGRCHRSEFLDIRTGEAPSVEALPTVHHDTSGLKGFRDPYDGPLYEVAKLRFQRDCWNYDVSVKSCQPCFRDAGVSVEA